ncbi:hypothetical protein ACFE04_015141 [Oxalis oulophora]
MSSSSTLILICIILVSSCSWPFLSLAQSSSNPKALLLYRTPLVDIKLVADIGGQHLWVDCDKPYVSSTYKPLGCKTTVCNDARSDTCSYCYINGTAPKPGCYKNTCQVYPDNSITHIATPGQVGQDVISLNSTNGFNPSKVVTVRNFTFACGNNIVLDGLAKGAVGMAGFGRTKVALPTQFATAFGFAKKFATCLPAVIFLGDGPYGFELNHQFTSDSLSFTPLITNPRSTATAYKFGEPSYEYFINVTSIKIDEKAVSLNKTLLTIYDTEGGYGGTKISSVNPYTVLESSIFKAVSNAFIKAAAARNITRVKAVSPFEVCFSSKNILSTRFGPSVPFIELVLHDGKTTWQFWGANSMVYVNDNVLCLAFVNGGLNPRTSIVIGGYQLEDHLVQFDLEKKRVGFSGLLYGYQTTCSNFNSTSIA